MQKQAPSFGRIFIMAAFALSCFGLLLFLWLAFGGSIPLKPKGYQFKVPFKEGTKLAQEVAGRGLDINNTIGNLEPFATDTDRVLKVLVSQQGAVQRLVRNTGVVFGALSERRGQLRGLITNANSVFQTTADRNQALQAAFRALPTFEVESRLTLNRLDTFAHNTNPLVTQLRPPARHLPPTLADPARPAPDLNPPFRHLG